MSYRGFVRREPLFTETHDSTTEIGLRREIPVAWSVIPPRRSHDEYSRVLVIAFDWFSGTLWHCSVIPPLRRLSPSHCPSRSNAVALDFVIARNVVTETPFYRCIGLHFHSHGHGEDAPSGLLESGRPSQLILVLGRTERGPSDPNKITTS